jgi:monofunctional biosynthetic peptidoglycan transglycosylase
MRVPADKRRGPATRARPRKKTAQPRPLARLAKWLAVLVAGFIVASLLLVLPWRWLDPPTTSFMLRDDSGRTPVLHDWVDWAALGTAAPLAVVAAEDQRFADHHGIDTASIRKSLDDARDGRRLRGASTLTQQLVKNLYLSPSRSFWRKGLEAWLALVTETCLSKRRILELYLNVVELGPGIYGTGAAAKQFFGKSPAALTDAEAALLAAVLPNPVRLRVDAPSPYVRERQAWILQHVARLRREAWLARIDG